MRQVTDKELEDLIIQELDKLEDCRGVKSVSFHIHPKPEDPSWTCSFVNFGSADKGSCLVAINDIVEKFQVEYELKPRS